MTTPPHVTLTALRADFPEFQIWLEQLSTRERFVARRQGPGPGLHTVVTSDPAELRAILAGARPQQEPGPASTLNAATAGRPA
jgi:hypothetical protein